jgi:hypothetical protein
MNSDTTTIDSLPLSPQSENIRMNINDENITVHNPAQSLSQYRDTDPAINQKNLNQFVSGIQQASAAGMTTLPSRDIPTNQQHLSQDVNIQPNYIPQPDNGRRDYIQEHQTSEDIIRNQAKKEMNKNSFDKWYDEFQTPILISILFFLFQLPIIQKQLCRIIPSLFNKDGNPSLSGYVFNSLAFSGVYYVLVKGMQFLER